MTSLSLQQVFTLASVTSCVNIREFLKDTTTADNHENVAWKREFTFFQFLSWLFQLTYFVKASELFWSWIFINISKFMKRINFVIACLRPPKNMKVGIFTGIVVQLTAKKFPKSVCKVVVLPCQAIAYHCTKNWIYTFALKFTTPCKLTSKCGIYHLGFWFPPSLHYFTRYLHRVNLSKSNFSCSVFDFLVATASLYSYYLRYIVMIDQNGGKISTSPGTLDFCDLHLLSGVHWCAVTWRINDLSIGLRISASVTDISLYRANLFQELCSDRLAIFTRITSSVHSKPGVDNLSLLMLCGDILRNPRPEWKYPCGVCQKPVKSN